MKEKDINSLDHTTWRCQYQVVFAPNLNSFVRNMAPTSPFYPQRFRFRTIPTQTPFGKSLLNPRKVIERKYISQGGEIVCYYSGMTFQNQLRLTTQMPNVIDLYTNKETTRVRNVYIGK